MGVRILASEALAKVARLPGSIQRAPARRGGKPGLPLQLACTGIGIFWVCSALPVTAADVPASSVLYLANGSFIPGQIQASDNGQLLRWRSALFAQPLDFPLGAIREVQYAVPALPPKTTGAYCFELAEGDVVYGELLSLTRDELELDAARIGRVHLRREQISRFYPLHSADLLYLGPNGLNGWKDMATAPQWREEGGQLATDRAGATLRGDFNIPAKSIIEFELSWKRKPDFVFALGVDDQEAVLRHAFRFEVWDNDLVAVGESERDADAAAALEQLGPGEGHVRFQVYLDQEKRIMLLFSRSGKALATLRIGTKKAQSRSGVRLTNRKGDIRLEYLRITRWNGTLPSETKDDQSRLHRTDGTIIRGQITAYDPALKQFTLRDGTRDTNVLQDAIADVFLSASIAPATGPSEPPAGTSGSALRVVYRDGSRFSGKVGGIEDTHISLTWPGVREPLRLPLAEVRSLAVLGNGDKPSEPSAQGPSPVTPGSGANPADLSDGDRRGRLEMDGVLLKGFLTSASARPGASCLVWHPDGGLNASPLVPGVSGRIVYRDPPPRPARPAPTPARRVVRNPPPAGGIRKKMQDAVDALEGKQTPTIGSHRSMHLRSGDTIPCEVSKIDDKGVTFKTPLSDATFVAHEKVKSVELIATDVPPRLGKAKRERLLTLPRMQKDSPPTHLICSATGDFLRGRILEMDDKQLRVEVRLENKEIPRDRVAQIIWFHADELADAKNVSAAAGAPEVTRVQVLRAPGNRLTFVAQKMEGGTISGVSDVLGPCRANLADVDELLFGAFIDQSAAKLAYHRWKLHHATEPKFVQADAAGASGGLSGTESPLCGQPAFAIKLDLLDGRKFQLADSKGRLVVLDFWATWCGPCMQSMPLIDEVVREFAGQGVELIAVDLEEQPDQIKTILERHKLKVPVALDRDGVVATKFAVTAIPQTVVVDRDGKIARIFVGGGRNTADSLRKALQELLAAKPGPQATLPRP